MAVAALMRRKLKEVRWRSVRYLLLPAARVMQPLAENGFNVQIDDNEIFFELFTARNQITVFIEDKTVTVENEFILSADDIVVRDNDRIVGRARREHLFAPMPFSRMVR